MFSLCHILLVVSEIMGVVTKTTKMIIRKKNGRMKQITLFTDKVKRYQSAVEQHECLMRFTVQTENVN